MSDLDQLRVLLTPFDKVDSVCFGVTDAAHRFDFCRPSWVAAWCQAYAPSGKWSKAIGYLSVSRGGQHLAGVGLGLQKVLGINVVSLGGYYWPYRTVCSNVCLNVFEQICGSLISGLQRLVRPRLLRLGPVSSEDPFLGSFVSQLQTKGWSVVRRKLGDSYCLQLPDTFEQFASNASGSVLKNAEYQIRRLKRLNHKVVAKRIMLSEMTAQDFADLSRIESGSWLAAAHGDLKFSSESDKAFWGSLSGRPSFEQHGVFWLLYAGAEPVAYSAHIESADCVYIFANGYLESHSQFSPGAVLSSFVFKDFIARGVEMVDWGMGDSGYKTRWGAKPRVQVFDYLLVRSRWLRLGLSFVSGKLLRNWEVVQ